MLQKTGEYETRIARKRQIMLANRAAVSRRRFASVRMKEFALVNEHGLLARGFSWLLPWSADGYPGWKGGAVELLAGRAKWAAFKHWRAGRRSMPEWFAECLADHIEARVKSGAELVAELRAYRKPERKRQGFLVVDPVTGQNKANRTGHKRTRQPSGNP